jgi:uncharacterized peroxidase-related enzyme
MDLNTKGETTMAVVSLLTNDQTAEKIRPIFEGIEKKGGAVPNVLRAMAHNPALLEGFLALNSALARTELDGKLRELAYIATSQLNGCDYCMQHHRTTGKKVGLSERQIEETAQFETSDAYDELQRDVMRYALEVTRHINASESLLERLHASLSDRQIVELAMTVGIANFTNRVTETLKMELP